jgi:uncharacterized membrane protein
VNTSRWSIFLGLPVAVWGLATYVVLLVLALVGVQDTYQDSRAISVALVVLSGWSVLFSGWLTYLELFRIHAICIWCVTSATILLVLFVTSLVDWRRTRPEPIDIGRSRPAMR